MKEKPDIAKQLEQIHNDEKEIKKKLDEIREEERRIEEEEKVIEEELHTIERKEDVLQEELRKFENEQTAFDIWIIFIILLVGIIVIGIIGYYYNQNKLSFDNTTPAITPIPELKEATLLDALTFPLESIPGSKYCGRNIFYFVKPDCDYCKGIMPILTTLKLKFGSQANITVVCLGSKEECLKHYPVSLSGENATSLAVQYGMNEVPSWTLGCKYRRNNPLSQYFSNKIATMDEIVKSEYAELENALCGLDKTMPVHCIIPVTYKKAEVCAECTAFDAIFQSILNPRASKNIENNAQYQGNPIITIPKDIVTYDVALRSVVQDILIKYQGEITFTIKDNNYIFHKPKKLRVAFASTTTCPICEDRVLREWLTDFNNMGGEVVALSFETHEIPFAPAIFVNAETIRAYSKIFTTLNDLYAGQLLLSLYNDTNTNSDIVIRDRAFQTRIQDCGPKNKSVVFFFYRPFDKLSLATKNALEKAKAYFPDQIAIKYSCIGESIAEEQACIQSVGLEDFATGKMLSEKYLISSVPTTIYNCRYIRTGSSALLLSEEDEAKNIKKDICTIMGSTLSSCQENIV